MRTGKDPGATLVPTLDIDLIWHVHMLSPHDYREDCKEMLGRLLTHDDQKSDEELSGAFEATQVEAVYGSYYDDAATDGGRAEPEPWATDAPAAAVAEDPWAAPASATDSEDYWWSSDSSSDTGGSSSWGWGSSDSSDSSCGGGCGGD